jgi:hypothetical protein
MHAHLQSRDIRYWRDKRGHEVDFVLARRKNPPLAIECKWSASEFDPTNLQAFRRSYTHGENFVVAHDVDRSFSRSYGGLSAKFLNLSALVSEVAG